MTADHCVEHKLEDGKTTYLGCLGHFGDMNTIFPGQYAVCSLTHTDAAHPVRSCALLSARFKDGVWWVVNPDIWARVANAADLQLYDMATLAQ